MALVGGPCVSGVAAAVAGGRGVTHVVSLWPEGGVTQVVASVDGAAWPRRTTACDAQRSALALPVCSRPRRTPRARTGVPGAGAAGVRGQTSAVRTAVGRTTSTGVVPALPAGAGSAAGVAAGAGVPGSRGIGERRAAAFLIRKMAPDVSGSAMVPVPPPRGEWSVGRGGVKAVSGRVQQGGRRRAVLAWL